MIKNLRPIIVCDMDGTLTKSRQPASADMISVIEKIAINYNFVVITGGKLDLIKEQITSLIKNELVTVYLFPTSGNQFWIFSQDGYENIYQNRISTDDQNIILNAIISCINRFNLVPITDDQIELRDSQITFSLLGRSAPYDLKVQYDPQGDKRKVFVEYMKKHHPVLSSNFEVRIGGTTSIDFTYRGMDKGFGLVKIKDFFRVDNSEILFFGDKCFEGGNDWEIAKHVPFVQVDDEFDTLEKFNSLLRHDLIVTKNNITNNY